MTETDFKTENTEQMVQPEPTKEQGISSVAAGSARNIIGMRTLFLLLAAIIAFVGLVMYLQPEQKNIESLVNHKNKEERTFVTSTRELTLPPLPAENKAPALNVNEPQIKENPLEKILSFGRNEVGNDAKPATTESPVGIPDVLRTEQVPVSMPMPVVAKETDKEPTLEERRFAAPMMGETEQVSIAKNNDQGYINETPPPSGGKLGSLMEAVPTPSMQAAHMPDRNMLLAKGAFIDCVLETRMDTTVPGMTSCVIPRDVYSANGKVLLIERGSKAVGEYKGSVENGLNRIFVLWTQVQTPKGVRVNLDSPTSDSLGGAGMTGDIDFHWWRRFGNALMFSLVQDGFDYGISAQTKNNGGVNYYQNSEDGMKEIIREAMRQSGNIPPTLTRNQGERIGIFVARDLDFSSVYRLRPTNQ